MSDPTPILVAVAWADIIVLTAIRFLKWMALVAVAGLIAWAIRRRG
jgi:hypothetical protein